MLGSVRIPIPAYREQTAIATFLDRETSQIDALIEKKKRQIELLKEKRSALISHAVTKGLDLKAKMKDSGIEWMEEIPEEWEICAVNHLFVLGRGRVISHVDILENPGNFPVYSSQTENDGILGHLKTYDFDGDYITWTTDGAKAGTVFRRNGRFNCTNVCGTLKPKNNNKVNNRFAMFALNLATCEFIRHDINPKLMNNVMARIRFGLPTHSEQTAIANHLDRETAKIDTLIEKVQTAIELLREKRSALITAAVTGKIDVREKAA